MSGIYTENRTTAMIKGYFKTPKIDNRASRTYTLVGIEGGVITIEMEDRRYGITARAHITPRVGKRNWSFSDAVIVHNGAVIDEPRIVGYTPGELGEDIRLAFDVAI